MERLSFGHGFIPRIGQQNYKALDRALAPPNLFGGEPSSVPWVIVDGAWATPDLSLLSNLRNIGVKVLVDTQGWRYRDERTWEVRKFANLVHRPSGPLSIKEPDVFVDFVGSDLEWQMKLGADALLVPGLMPEKDDDSAIRSLELASDVALNASAATGMPTIGYLGVHSQNIADVSSHASDSALTLLSGLYVQVSPVDPIKDAVSKLVDVARAMKCFENSGRDVIAGHLGAFGGVLRSMGISAADAGLGTSETFSAKRLVMVRRKESGKSKGGPIGNRRYMAQILRSVSRKEWESMMAIDSIRGFLDCRLECCRFKTTEDRTEWAREHSLRARVSEAVELAGYPSSMKPGQQLDVLRGARASLVTVNSALSNEGEPPIPMEHVENQIAALERLRAEPGAA